MVMICLITDLIVKKVQMSNAEFITGITDETIDETIALLKRNTDSMFHYNQNERGNKYLRIMVEVQKFKNKLLEWHELSFDAKSFLAKYESC